MGITRKARIDDSQDIFDWRNDPDTRRMSHSAQEVNWETHSQWFTGALADPTRFFVICETVPQGDNIGVVRFDIADAEALTSINLAPAMRGKGLAKACLTDAISFFAAQHPEIAVLRAEIKQKNTASIALFEGAGFSHADTINDILHYCFTLK